MNEPIVSPLFVYFLSKIDTFISILVFSTLSIIIVKIILDYRDKIKINFMKYLIIFLTSLTLISFIPSKDTIIKMYVASIITKKNLHIAKTEIVKLIEKITSKMVEKTNENITK